MGKPDKDPIPDKVLTDLKAAARYAASGVRGPDVMRQAAERMDRMREEARQKQGTLDVAAELIRQVRDEA
jgi:hypothetical protein